MEDAGMPEHGSRESTGDLFGESFEQCTKQLAGVRGADLRVTGKYAPLARYLENIEEQVCVLQFKEVEEILGSELPSSAKRKPTGWLWWTNDLSRTQARNGWSAAGWIVSKVDYVKKIVSLRRR